MVKFEEIKTKSILEVTSPAIIESMKKQKNLYKQIEKTKEKTKNIEANSNK